MAMIHIWVGSKEKICASSVSSALTSYYGGHVFARDQIDKIKAIEFSTFVAINHAQSQLVSGRIEESLAVLTAIMVAKKRDIATAA